MFNPAYNSLDHHSDKDQVFNMTYFNGPESEDPHSTGHDSEFNPEWSPDLDPDDLRELRAAQQGPTKIISELPRGAVRMGCYSRYA